mgnify:CR=1 FL=1
MIGDRQAPDLDPAIRRASPAEAGTLSALALRSKAHWGYDADFLAALEFGMPESAGIALGFDRLSMLCTGAQEIEDILWAPVAGIEG